MLMTEINKGTVWVSRRYNVAMAVTSARITLARIRAAALALEDQIVRTPCTRSATLSEITGTETWVKFENLQFTAAFKERGALTRLLALSDSERKAGVIAASAGNHAQGVAYHAHRLAIPAVIVMPRLTPQIKVARTRSHGAEVVLHGDSFDAAHAHALTLVRERGLVMVHPSDDEKIIAGQGTVALEMLAEGLWTGAGVLGPEAFPADPFLELLSVHGAPWAIEERTA